MLSKWSASTGPPGVRRMTWSDIEFRPRRFPGTNADVSCRQKRASRSAFASWVLSAEISGAEDGVPACDRVVSAKNMTAVAKAVSAVASKRRRDRAATSAFVRIETSSFEPGWGVDGYGA